MSATYKMSHYQAIFRVQSTHFWFRARARMLSELISRFIDKKERQEFLDIGCGTGNVLTVVKTLGFSPTGMDVNLGALCYAKAACPGARLIRSSIYSFQPTKQYGSIGAFDVLEHQARDELFLKRCRDLLKEGGTLFLTVPCGMWLWSGLDTLSGHKRRYMAGDIRKKLERAGFGIQFINYWNTISLPWYILFRIYANRKKTLEAIPMYLNVPHRFINGLCYSVLRLEQSLLFRVPFPFGATLVICAKK